MQEHEGSDGCKTFRKKIKPGVCKAVQFTLETIHVIYCSKTYTFTNPNSVFAKASFHTVVKI